jgi:serine/threonine protein kinase/formylglycine-generating enzyme required for sulfatase activity
VPSLPDWSPPAEFDEYRLIRSLGRGGMGQVYLAYDTVLARHVAVKFISTLNPGLSARRRFLVEARAAARLQHPNVVTIHRVGELEQQPYLVSEFVGGQPLDRVARPMPWPRVLHIGVNLARGLAAAHRQGVLHRDIKPGNAILADDGHAKLLDFGLAKLLVETPEDAAGPEPTSGMSSTTPTGETRLRAGGAAAITRAKEGEGEGPIHNHPTLDPARATADSPGAGETTVPPEGILTPPEGRSKPSGGSPTPRDERPMTPLRPPKEVEDPAPALPATRAGVVLGTPYYIAPEIWRGQEATRCSDVYGLGAVLYELCAGRPPHYGVTAYELAEVTAERDVPQLAQVAPGVDPRLAAIVDRCLMRDPQQRFASGEELCEALEALARTTAHPAGDGGNPYRGLAPFDAEHRALFFGRRQEVDHLLDRLRRDPFVLVTGDSGVGKSSLCRAGLIPLVAEGALGEGRTWQVLQMVPGRRPLASLIGALATSWPSAEALLERDRKRTPASLSKAPNPWAALGRQLGERRGLVLLVDQLEELVTLGEPTEVSTVAFVLGQLALGIPGMRLLGTVRADFLTRLANLPGLGESLSRALYILRPLAAVRMREAVLGPAAVTGTQFESEALVDTLIEHAARGGSGLPLLQFALAELWEVRDRERNLITAQALEAIGGVAGALARHADTVFDGLLPAERVAARRILVRLVTVEGTRARFGEDELGGKDPVAHNALDALVRGRLVTAEEDNGKSIYSLAHEALLGGWSTLRGWLVDDSERRLLLERLGRAAADWERLGRAHGALWSAPELAEAEDVQLAEQDLPPREVAFLAASRKAVRFARWQRRILMAGLPLLLALAYGAVRLQARHAIARRVEAHLAEVRQTLEEARIHAGERARVRQHAFGRFDAGARDAGEELWARALQLDREVDRRQARASQTLEEVLALDGTRQGVRALLADVLYDRALLAEQERRFDQLDELLERLALYDADGERRRKWRAPARLTLASTPPGATVSCHRYAEDDRQKLRLMEPRVLGQTPLREVSLAPGSYLLTLERGGHAVVRYPLVLGRGEELRLDVELPAADAVPEGFVYIPTGRFLFGTPIDGDLRRSFLNTAPLHEVRIGAYLIARNEVTYGEWLEFLRQLPAAERERRMPRVIGSSFTDPLALDLLPGGIWQLSLQPGKERHVARIGEKIHYPGRQRQAVQDWLRLPVAGISAEDADAYLEWLRRTGRLPGARLCTEHEWERAARGADARPFPHGGRLDPEDANFDETYGKDPSAMGPDEVGSHPASRSPFGVDDLCGNVFEWTASSLAPDERAVRGGSYLYDPTTDRIDNRQVPVVTFRDANLGLRVCASFPLR